MADLPEFLGSAEPPCRWLRTIVANRGTDTELGANTAPLAPRLEVRGLECVRADSLVFSALSFTVQGGEILQILGANGSGKTSLLRILSGLSQPTEGEFSWRGKGTAKDLQAWQRELLYVGHVAGVTATLSVSENLRYALALSGRCARLSLPEAIARVGLPGYAAVLAGRLSAGQRQRVALARLLLIPAAVWLLDEPLTALDPSGKILLEAMLRQHAQVGGLALVVTHQTLDIPAPYLRSLQLVSPEPL